MRRNFKQLYWILLLIASLYTFPASAQRYKKYYLEVGLLGGSSFYLGDINKQVFANMLPTAGGFAKYKFNHHWELKFQATSGEAGIGILDDGSFRKTFFVDGALISEFNFFNYAAGPYEPFSSKVSPYIFAGIGVSVFNSSVAGILPFGIGVKYRMTNRLNIGAYWSMNKVIGSDNFDNIDNPLGLNRSIWNNTDWYSTTAIYVSIDLWEKCAPCRDGSKKYKHQSF